MQNNNFDDLMHGVAKKSIEKFTYKGKQELISEFNSTQKKELVDKILLLPEPYLSIVLLYYVFEDSCDEIENITGQTNIQSKLQYANLILVQALSLPTNSIIADSIMKEAAKEALAKYVSTATNNISSLNPNYSTKFRKKLKDIKIPHTKISLIIHIGKRIAVACLALVITFTVTMTVNAKFREFVINWFIETFPAFSTFQSHGEGKEFNEDNITELYRYQPQYLPDGFSFSEQIERPTGIVKRYYDNNMENKIVFMANFVGHPVNLNTEGAEVIETAIVSTATGEENIAYKWDKDGTAFIVWSMDGYDFYLIGEITLGEMVKVAESVEK